MQENQVSSIASSSRGEKFRYEFRNRSRVRQVEWVNNVSDGVGDLRLRLYSSLSRLEAGAVAGASEIVIRVKCNRVRKLNVQVFYGSDVAGGWEWSSDVARGAKLGRSDRNGRGCLSFMRRTIHAESGGGGEEERRPHHWSIGERAGVVVGRQGSDAPARLAQDDCQTFVIFHIRHLR